ncbi:MAG: hypothetical protein LIO54_05610, partial [Oscillospiraceae bacterium]|nr:hypothetical protein [Oscillospiraceae bacterium]
GNLHKKYFTKFLEPSGQDEPRRITLISIAISARRGQGGLFWILGVIFWHSYSKMEKCGTAIFFTISA